MIDLDDDDYSLDLNASHQWDIASAALLVGYRDNGIRTSEFNTATPGQTTDDSQETWSLRSIVQLCALAAPLTAVHR